jgi:hypothetical protein
MFSRRILDRTLASAGFRRVAPLAYAMPSACECVSWEAWVVTSSADRQEFDFGITAYHPEASAFARTCLSLYAGERWAAALSNFPDLFRGVASPIREFDDRLSRVPLSHRESSAEETASLICSSLRESVAPFIASVDSERAYYDALSQDTPLNWRFTHPLLQVAQLGFLGVRLGVADAALQDALMQRPDRLQQQLGPVVDVMRYIDSVVSAARKA